MGSGLSPAARLQDLSHASVRDTQATRGAKRKVEEAVAWSSIGNTNHHRHAARKIGYV
jgi:hypothetical protein